LCSYDFKDKIEVDVKKDIPFDKVADNPAIYFQKEDDSNIWEMKSRSPFLSID